MLNILPYIFILSVLGTGLASCGSGENETSPPDSESSSTSKENNSGFQLFSIQDSSKIVAYENGLQLYTVLEGPGQFPVDGMNILVNYHGLLEEGSTFDSSYDRGNPLEVRIGQGKLIRGLEYAIKQLRMGSKAIAIIPPFLGYGSKKDVPRVPPNSTLILHIEVLGTF